MANSIRSLLLTLCVLMRLVAVGPVWGQVISSDPFEGVANGDFSQTPSFDPFLAAERLHAPAGVTPVDFQLEQSQPQLPPGARDGIFQKLFFTGTYLPQLEDDSLGWGYLETGVVLGFPFLRRDTPLLVTPQFATRFIDAPAGVDLPDQVYDALVEFRHLRKVGHRWGLDLAIAFGSYSDFEADSSDALRVTGHGIAAYDWSSSTKVVGGVAYLDRADISVLPVGGVIYQPHADVKYEAIFPRPRASWRFADSVPGVDEKWLYLGGDFGSGEWAIVRPATQTPDVITYTDIQLLVGYERKITGGFSRYFEFGYVFGRELLFQSATPDLRLDDTLFARVGVSY